MKQYSIKFIKSIVWLSIASISIIQTTAQMKIDASLLSEDNTASVLIVNLDRKSAFATEDKEDYIDNKSNLTTDFANQSGTTTVELLRDQFFYEFENTTPKQWEVVGKVAKIDGNGRYNSNTGFAVGITTDDNKGIIKQRIDLNATDKKVIAGDEIECLIHYFTAASTLETGPFRLACRWLDIEDKEIANSEQGLINNPELFFGRAKAYGELKFRTICPAGAVTFEFALEIAPNSEVRVDDFSALRLAQKDKTPLVAIIPQYRTIYGEVGISKSYPIAIQGMHLADDQVPNFSGHDSHNVMTLDIAKLPKNGTIATKLNIKPTKKGVFPMGKSGSYGLKFGGADPENTGILYLTSYFRGTEEPAITLVNNAVETMEALPNKSQVQKLEFNIKNVINHVNLAINQPSNGPFRINTTQFYYSSSSDKVLANTVNVVFEPKVEGEFNATLTLTSEFAQPLIIDLKGLCRNQDGNLIIERFSADNKMDARFTGDAWTNYHKFDQGYWQLEGKWVKANHVELNANGKLYYDELQPNGVNTLKVEPVSNATNCAVEYSVDGGGHWNTISKSEANGMFVVNSHRPTLVRLINTGNTAIRVDSITITPFKSDFRTKFNNIDEAMLIGVDTQPLTQLNETFNGLRHSRILSIDGWQNINVRAERPFYAWQQKNASQNVIENEVAQISFLYYGKTDDREHETWLISPILSYTQAASKVLTFSLRYANAVENGQEAFGLNIITEKEGKPNVQYIDIREFIPQGIIVEPETWFDYYIDLSQVEGLSIEDKFHIAFSFYSPVGGNKTSLNFMIDDVTFGRNDLPTISVDRDLIHFNFIPGKEMQPEVFNIKTERATAPVTITMVPARANDFFKISNNKLPSTGGTAAVGFKSDKNNTYKASLLVQTRSAASKIIQLLATTVTNVDEVNSDGVKVFPTCTTDNLYIEGDYNSYSLYTTNGHRVKTGSHTPILEINSLSSGFYILHINSNSKVQSFIIEKR